MEWHPAQLTWDMQTFVLWVLLPPVFIVCGLMAFLAPTLYRDQEVSKLTHTGAVSEKNLADERV
jgi:hypothetical protein